MCDPYYSSEEISLNVGEKTALGGWFPCHTKGNVPDDDSFG